MNLIGVRGSVPLSVKLLRSEKMNRRKSKPIDIAKLANRKDGEARTMLKELEGEPTGNRSADPRWPSRFTSVGPKDAR